MSPGQLFADRYQIKKLLGRGGMGEVYLAQDMLLEGMVVALKVLNPELAADGSYLRRFLREIQLTRKVTHPAVARTFDAGSYQGVVYFAMEHVQGSELNDLMGRGPMPVAQVCSILQQICQGLTAIHEVDIVHRDLKPANIMLGTKGEVKITDFGIARSEASSLTASNNEILGSAPYMAPELWNGDNIGPVTDIYALGILSYEMLTGQQPFEALTPAEFMYHHLNVLPSRPSEFNRNLPDWIDGLLLAMLAKNPQQRIGSAAEIAEWLTKGSDGDPELKPFKQNSDIFAPPHKDPESVMMTATDIIGNHSSEIESHLSQKKIGTEIGRVIGDVQSTMIYRATENKLSLSDTFMEWVFNIAWFDVARYCQLICEATLIACAAAWLLLSPLTRLYEVFLASSARLGTAVFLMAMAETFVSIALLLTVPILAISRVFLTRRQAFVTWFGSGFLLTIVISLLFFLQMNFVDVTSTISSSIPFSEKALAAMRRVISGIIEISLLIPFDGLGTITSGARRTYPGVAVKTAEFLYAGSSVIIYVMIASVLERLVLRTRGLYVRHWSMSPQCLIVSLIVFESVILGFMSMSDMAAVQLPWIGTVRHSVHYYGVLLAAMNWCLIWGYFSLLLKGLDATEEIESEND